MKLVYRAIAILLALTLPAVAGESADFRKQLDDIDARAAKIKDFTSAFRQQKFTALLKKPLESSGVVRVASSVVRWDTQKPEPAVLHSDGREVRMYYPSQKLLEIYTIDQRLGELASSPLPKLATLREHFKLERGDIQSFKAPKGREVLPVSLVPSDKALREHVDRVNVLLDVQAAHIIELEIVDADGDRTHMTFSNVRLDTGLKPAELELKVPADTTVSRPLDAKS
jgi:outer membrane lipoprotein-sorting protein